MEHLEVDATRRERLTGFERDAKTFAAMRRCAHFCALSIRDRMIPYHSTDRLNVGESLISLTQYDVVSQQWSRLLKIALFTVLATKERLRSDG
jgi:hypothetical protein